MTEAVKESLGSKFKALSELQKHAESLPPGNELDTMFFELCGVKPLPDDGLHNVGNEVTANNNASDIHVMPYLKRHCVYIKMAWEIREGEVLTQAYPSSRGHQVFSSGRNLCHALALIAVAIAIRQRRDKLLEEAG